MAQTFLIFDFGTDEDAAQKARHKIEGWKQGFRLGNKMLLKFAREEESASAEEPEAEAKGKKKASAKKEEAGANGRVKILVRLDFSDHEKISSHRWIERIPTEEPFKLAKAEIVRPADEAFAATAGQFDSLD